MQIDTILLQAASGGQGGGISGLLMIVAMIAIFWFVMIRPQSKKQKELKRQREAMKKGDNVVTAGGIHGRIRDLTDTVVFMEVAPNVTIKLDKASVYPLVEQTAPASRKESKPSKAEKAEKAEKEEVAEKAED